MNAEILAVGTELLLGDIVNTNAQYLSRKLAELGIGVFYQTVVGDNETRLLNAYKIAFERSNIVITTGGLGPTEDDLTKEVAAKYFNRQLKLDEESLTLITEYFAKNSFTITESNKKQAYLPEGARAMANRNGTAPGVIFEDNDKLLIMLPGPPPECIPMFEEFVLPILRESSDCVFTSRVMRVCGIGESALEGMLKDMLEAQDNPSIALYATTGEVRIRLTASASSENAAHAIIEPVAAEIYKRLGDNIYGEGETKLEDAVGNLLIERGLTLACAESCTGGLLTARLVNHSGISKTLMESVISYSNAAKVARLGVSEETLNNHGAVSAECAVEMALGVARTAGTNVGISTTGIAGPDGGSDEKPVGLVYIGLAVNGNATVKEYKCSGSRQRIRERAVTLALDTLRRGIP